MEALRKFIIEHASIGDAWKALETADKKKVLCPNQAVCGSCTIILEALGFVPKGMTEFSTEQSGGVSWGANMKVRELMDHGGLSDTYQLAVTAGAK